MAYSKSEKFEQEDVEMARVARALSHPGRVAILKMLAKRQCVCGEIVADLPLAQATVSQHLKELKEAGLIQGNIQGPAICYCLDRKVLRQYEKRTKRFWNSVLKTR